MVDAEGATMSRSPSPEPGSFAVFYRRHARTWCVLHAPSPQPELAADLTAETFAAALVQVRALAPAAVADRHSLPPRVHKLARVERQRGGRAARTRRRLGMERIELT